MKRNVGPCLGSSWTPAARRVANALGVLALLAIAIQGLFLRLRNLDESIVVMDTLHPFLRAMPIARGVGLPWQGVGVNFRFGVLQAYLNAPLVALAHGLRDLFYLNAVVHGSAVLFLGLAGHRMGGWASGLLAAALYATWPVLVEHSHYSAYTYKAPVLLAGAAWVMLVFLESTKEFGKGAEAWAERVAQVVFRSNSPGRGGSRGRLSWALVLVVLLAVAINVHPYAAAVALAAAFLMFAFQKKLPLVRPLPCLVLGMVLISPMLLDNAVLLWNKATAGESLSLVQDSTMAAQSLLFLLKNAALQAGTGWPPWLVVGAWLAPTSSIVLVCSTWRRGPTPQNLVVYWYLLSFSLLLSMAWLMGYLQPYHLAVLLPLHILVGSWGLVTLLSKALVLVSNSAWLVLRWVVGALAVVLPLSLASPARNGPAVVDESRLATVERVVVAIRLYAGNRPRTLAMLAEAPQATLGDPIAYFMEQWLAGDPDALFPARLEDGQPMAFLVADLTRETWASMKSTPSALLVESTSHASILKLLPFHDILDARRWFTENCAEQSMKGVRVFGPMEGVGGVAGLPENPDTSLLEWALPCQRSGT